VGSTTREMWAQVLRSSARQGLVLDLAAAVMQDTETAAYHPLLTRLLGDRLGPVNARRAVRFGLASAAADEPVGILESLVNTPTAIGDEPTGGLEAITSVTAGLEDPATYVTAILDAMSRTAMIELDGHPRGTGFLVGPDLVLTAAHVVTRDSWPPEPLPTAHAVFDYAAGLPRSQAETGVRVRIVDFVTASLPTAEERAGTATWGSAPADRLDFALLRLASAPPGRAGAAGAGGDGRAPRGRYLVDDTGYDFGSSPLMFVTQHPLGEFQRVTWIKSAPEVNAAGTRIRYGGNTLNGSSGSPVVDIRGRLVAVHHYGGAGRNQGVPAYAIARMLAERGLASLLAPGAEGAGPAPAAAVAEVDPFVTTTLMGRPFVDRRNLRRRVREMAATRDGNRTLAISGESGSGVSYSYLLTSYVAELSKACASLTEVAPEGLAALKIDLRDYVSFGVDERRDRIIGDLLVNLGMRQPTEPLAQEARHINSLRAWLIATLRGGPKQWWVFFDSIDQMVAVRQGQVDELIHAVISVAEDPQVPMRVVLAGREAEQFAQEHASWLEQDTATGFVRSDVELWVRTRADEVGRVVDLTRLDQKLSGIFPVGGPLPEPRKVAPMLPKLLLDVLEA